VFWSAEREREMCRKGSKYVRERERGSERRGVVICRCLECIEREMCCKCSKCFSEREREGERRGVVICKVLRVQTERERCVVSA
jgi:hypothetical protein